MRPFVLSLLVSAFLPGLASAFVLLPSMASSSTTISRLAMTSNDFETPDMSDVGFVLLAGGTGSRMKANMRESNPCG